MSTEHRFVWRQNSEVQDRAIQQLAGEEGIRVKQFDGGYEILVAGSSFDDAQDLLQAAYARHAQPEGFVEVMVEDD